MSARQFTVHPTTLDLLRTSGLNTAFGYSASDPVAGTGLAELDFVALPRGHGVSAVRVDKAQTLRDALQPAPAAPVPLLVEVELA